MKNIFTGWYNVKMHLCAGNWTFIDYGKHTTNEDQSTTSIITLTPFLPFSKKYLQLKKYFCWYIICLEKKKSPIGDFALDLLIAMNDIVSLPIKLKRKWKYLSDHWDWLMRLQWWDDINCFTQMIIFVHSWISDHFWNQLRQLLCVKSPPTLNSTNSRLLTSTQTLMSNSFFVYLRTQ